MISVAEARTLLLAHCSLQSVETVSLRAALGRILAQTLTVPHDLPTYRRAAMDGFAVRAADIAGAGVTQPVGLQMIGRVTAGGQQGPAVEPGSAVAVATGAAVPPGADAVVRLEDAWTQDEQVAVLRPAAVGDNIDPPGSDLQQGVPILVEGRRLLPADIALAAALGHSRLSVRRRPRVTIFCTGDELVGPEADLAPGQVRHSNAYALDGLVRGAGGRPRFGGVIPDRVAALTAAIEAALGVPLILTTGGASVGHLDLLQQALARLGAEMLFAGVNMKPGRPTLAARLEKTLLIGLPGNPSAAMTAFYVLGHSALGRMCGDQGPVEIWAALDHQVQRRPGPPRYGRAHLYQLGGSFRVRLGDLNGKGQLSPMVETNSLAVIPPGEDTLDVGAPVQVIVGGAADALAVLQASTPAGPAGRGLTIPVSSGPSG